MPISRGSNWNRKEVEASVQAYFATLTKELRSEPFVKAKIYKELAEKFGRTSKSIERKFQNISAILDLMGREWITGLAPLRNYQELLAQSVSDYVQVIDAIQFQQKIGTFPEGFQEAPSFLLEPPPKLQEPHEYLPSYMKALVRKFDPVERDMKNAALGEAGEQFVLDHEKRFLTLIDRSDLAGNVRWVSKEEGDGAGYDILSFDDRGEKKYVEVKTTLGSNRTPFYVSRNEMAFCKKNASQFNLVRLYDFRKAVKGFELRGDLEKHVNLSTEVFRAEFG